MDVHQPFLFCHPLSRNTSWPLTSVNGKLSAMWFLNLFVPPDSSQVIIIFVQIIARIIWITLIYNYFKPSRWHRRMAMWLVLPSDRARAEEERNAGSPGGVGRVVYTAHLGDTRAVMSRLGDCCISNDAFDDDNLPPIYLIIFYIFRL